jgi:hypothetical protein
MASIELRDYLNGVYADGPHSTGTGTPATGLFVGFEDPTNTATNFKVKKVVNGAIEDAIYYVKYDVDKWNIYVDVAMTTKLSGVTKVTPMLEYLVHVFNSDITTDIFVSRIGKFVSENSPTTAVDNTYYSVMDKFALFLHWFGQFIDYEGAFGNDYATLKTKTTAVETAFDVYTNGTNPYPHDASGLLAAINAVKTHVHTVIYPKCKIVKTNNLKGSLDAQFNLLKTAVEENVAADTLVTMPDTNVCTEFGVM